jgi:hypothetical protein
LDLRNDDQSDPGNCQMIGGATIASVDMDDLATIPLIALSASRARKRCGHLVDRARFQIHLKFAFCSSGGISVC